MAVNKLIRRDFIEEIEIPTGMEANVENNVVTIKKDGKEMKRIVDKEISVKKDGNKVILSVKKARKNEKRKFGTAVGHIKNMTSGFTEAYVYELEICNVHFPMTVTFDKAKSQFIIKNLLGEKHPRIVEVSKNIEVEVKAPNIKIKSYDIESAGQAASRLERCALVRYRDRNKFQDGIFITKKPGKSYL
jgi:large subunit ribosomal protein L6